VLSSIVSFLCQKILTESKTLPLTQRRSLILDRGRKQRIRFSPLDTRSLRNFHSRGLICVHLEHAQFVCCPRAGLLL
jgi:hypothetical protein